MEEHTGQNCGLPKNLFIRKSNKNIILVDVHGTARLAFFALRMTSVQPYTKNGYEELLGKA